MKNKASTLLYTAPLSFIALCCSPTVHAQERAADERVEDQGVQEIVVTAERRETRLQDTPAAISVVSGETVEARQTYDIEDATNLFAGLKMDANSRDQSRIQLRGNITTNDSAGTDQGFGYFIDGVYMGRSFMLNQSLPDVERLELLRGPQGTLFGHNILSGALNVVTRDPSNQFEAEARVTIGNYDTLNYSGRISGPVIDDVLLAQISVQRERADGYVLNLSTGNKVNGTDVDNVRGKLIWRPSSQVDVELSLGYQNDNSFGHGSVIVVANPSPYIATPKRDQTYGFDGQYDTRLFTGTLGIDWRLGSVTLSSLTGYIDYISDNRDFSLLPGNAQTGIAVRNVGATEDIQFTQELRLANDPTSSLIWQVGLYYYYATDRKLEDWSTISGLQPTFIAKLNRDVFGIPLGGSQDNIIIQDAGTDSYAVFGQATYKLNDIFSITAGGRYTYVDKSSASTVTGDVGSPFLAAAPYSVTGTANWDAFTPKVTVDALLKDRGMFDSLLFYGTVARGWKAGGFDPGTSARTAVIPFKPESVWSYEIGAKSVFLDGTASLNLSAFRAEYSDQQTRVIDALGTSDTQNADVRVDGIEIESSWRPVRGINLSAAYAYYDARYKAGAVLQGANVSGNRPALVPASHLTLAADFNLPVSDRVELLAGIDYSYKSRFYVNANNAVLNSVPGARQYTQQDLLGARIGVDIGKRWNFTLWGRNLLDDFYVLRGSNTIRLFWYPTPGQAFAGTRGKPRTFGATLAARF